MSRSFTEQSAVLKFKFNATFRYVIPLHNAQLRSLGNYEANSMMIIAFGMV